MQNTSPSEKVQSYCDGVRVDVDSVFCGVYTVTETLLLERDDAV